MSEINNSKKNVYYICATPCPELDMADCKHCVMTLDYIEERRNYGLSECPVGYTPIWNVIRHEEGEN